MNGCRSTLPTQGGSEEASTQACKATSSAGDCLGESPGRTSGPDQRVLLSREAKEPPPGGPRPRLPLQHCKLPGRLEGRGLCVSPVNTSLQESGTHPTSIHEDPNYIEQGRNSNLPQTHANRNTGGLRHPRQFSDIAGFIKALGRAHPKEHPAPPVQGRLHQVYLVSENEEAKPPSQACQRPPVPT